MQTTFAFGNGALQNIFTGYYYNPVVGRLLIVVFKSTNKLGTAAFHSAMKFLGINSFSLIMDNSKFIAMARVFNAKVIIRSYDWAVKLYSKANELGYRISLDTPHNGYTWHMHISGTNGKLLNLHIQIEKKQGITLQNC